MPVSNVPQLLYQEALGTEKSHPLIHFTPLSSQDIVPTPAPEMFPLHLLENPAQQDKARWLALHEYLTHYGTGQTRGKYNQETLDFFYPSPGRNENILGITIGSSVVATCHFGLSKGKFGGQQIVTPLDPENLIIQPHETCLEIGRLAIDRRPLIEDLQTLGLYQRGVVRQFITNFYRQIFTAARNLNPDRIFIVVRPELQQSLIKNRLSLSCTACRLYKPDELKDYPGTEDHYKLLPGYFAEYVDPKTMVPYPYSHFICESLTWLTDRSAPSQD